MAENNECTHDCSTCSQNCSSRDKNSAPTYDAPHKDSHIKHVIGVVSGKGGVGKSIVTSMLATAMRRRDYNVAILDADITGPSIPKAFGAKGDILKGAIVGGIIAGAPGAVIGAMHENNKNKK